MMRCTFLFTLLLFFFVVPVFGQEYTVGENDVLKISVYGHDDLTTTVRVSGDGTITLPLLDKVKVTGLSSTQISDKITTLLAKGYIVSPQVNVFVADFRSRVFYVSGEVKKPDAYQFEENMTVIKAITRAGGFTDSASKNSVTIVRKINDREQVVEKVEMHKSIQPEDLIIVPESIF